MVVIQYWMNLHSVWLLHSQWLYELILHILFRSPWIRLRRIWTDSWWQYQMRTLQTVLKSGKDSRINVWGPKRSTFKRTKALLPAIGCFFLNEEEWSRESFIIYIYIYVNWKHAQHNGYHHMKWNWWPRFKSWMKLLVFYFVLMPLWKTFLGFDPIFQIMKTFLCLILSPTKRQSQQILQLHLL